MSKSKLYLIRYLNIVNIFSIKLDNIKLIKFYLPNFLKQRGFKPMNSNTMSSIFSGYHGFDILGYFYKSFNIYYFSCLLSCKNIKNQKAKLKLLIKNFIDLPIAYLIKHLNILITNWSNIYNLSDSFYHTCQELDLYLNKLLWRWVKRRHPRRKSVWLYSKYWKYFLGKWRFFAIDILTTEIVFLNSHFVCSIKKVSLPHSLSIFDYLDSNKTEKFCFEKLIPNITGILKFIWVRQKGICLICKKIFTSVDLIHVRLYYINDDNNSLKNVFFVHNYCNF